MQRKIKVQYEGAGTLPEYYGRFYQFFSVFAAAGNAMRVVKENQISRAVGQETKKK